MRIVPMLLFAAASFGQSFEVATVKPGTGEGFSDDISPEGRYSARNHTVWNILRFSYGLTDLQIAGGPAWVKTHAG